MDIRQGRFSKSKNVRRFSEKENVIRLSLRLKWLLNPCSQHFCVCLIKFRRTSSREVGAGLLVKRKPFGQQEQLADDGYKLKEQHCHLPGFLGITILVAGSACQPWLTTPLDKDRGGKGEENTLMSEWFCNDT